KGRHHEFGFYPQTRSGLLGKVLGLADLCLMRSLDVRDQVRVLPDRNAVLAPVKTKSPARQAFAGIPFALPVMQQSARRKTCSQFSDEFIGEAAFGRTDGRRVRFRGLDVVDRGERRLAD